MLPGFASAGLGVGPHRFRHPLVRVAERDAVADEGLRGIRREQERIGGRGRESAFVEVQAGDEHTECRERTRDIAARCEHRRLVLLQVAIVGERETLDRREQPGEAADPASAIKAAAANATSLLARCLPIAPPTRQSAVCKG